MRASAVLLTVVVVALVSVLHFTVRASERAPLSVTATAVADDDPCIPRRCVDRSFASVFSAAQHAQCFVELRSRAALCEAWLEQQRNEEQGRRRKRPTVLVHGFWAGDLSADHTLLFKSFVLTQPSTAHMILWVLREPDEASRTWHADAVKVLKRRQFMVRRFVPREHLPTQLRGSPIEQLLTTAVDLAIAGQLPLRQLALLSDAVRMTVLPRFGGLYVDVDTVLLRDLTPLLALRPFAHTWSFHTYRWNTAFMGAEEGDGDMAWLLGDVAATVARTANFTQQMQEFHPLRTGHRLAGKPGGFTTALLSCYLFDPVWLKHEDMESTNAFVREKLEATTWVDLLVPKLNGDQRVDASLPLSGAAPGAFAFHHHNHFGAAQIGSYAEMINNRFKRVPG